MTIKHFLKKKSGFVAVNGYYDIQKPGIYKCFDCINFNCNQDNTGCLLPWI